MSFLNDIVDTVKNIDFNQVKQVTGNRFESVEDYMARTETRSDPDYARGFVAGLIGGLVGTLVKTAVDAMLPTDQPKQEREARLQVIEGAEDLTGVELTNSQERIGQQVLDFGVGTLIGGVYGVVAEAMPDAQVPAGVPFGATLWTVTHKAAMPLLGLAPAALQDKAGRQLGQFAGHIAYGVTVEVVRRGVRHLMEEEDLL